MLSAKTAHELQLSLYKLVICHIYYRISVFKMAGKDWLLAAFLRNKTNPSHVPISLSLSTFSKHWPTTVTFERVKLLKNIKFLDVL